MALRPMRRSGYSVLTFGALAAALAVCVSWLVTAPPGNRWEPVIQTLALVAAISGVFAERLAAAQERERQTLRALADELAKNTAILYDPRFAPLDPDRPVHRVFPRPVLSATDAALVSGVLADRGHSALVALLHAWRDTVHELNRRLDLAELRSFVVEAQSAELLSVDRDLRRTDGHLHRARHLRGDIERLLLERYGHDAELAARVRAIPAPPGD
ncbi:hypothetical protein RKE29_06445 [Streptomyces sp. B1866]|uniref:hypothetical protein n=1 Tax=Streptomyces sp. B1866 TaxID=3075431 RepID=UPI00288FF839|nr:hypothetical protein [Streptomyces sp. B1866]MDT3396280.1 hypothetical protein [Streptomyces sp. B1866]